MKHFSLIVWILALGSSSIGLNAVAKEKPAPPPYDKTISNTQALQIAEATFRYQFNNNASARQQNAAAYFLTLFRKDPTPQFMKRFESHKPPVTNGSKFKVGKGLSFYVSSIKRIDKTKVQVTGGYYEAGLSSSGCTYTVEFKDKKWVVTKRALLWIS